MELALKLAYFVPLVLMLGVAVGFLVTKANLKAASEIRAIQTVILAVIPVVNILTLVMIVLGMLETSEEEDA